mmetsp:Transcript_39749/g.113506  ORF Transcript_39749/g.113506 Transcript_39749/m.113506 type:complete len:265 (+) Transcript_39749:1025-1819(+)
MLISSPVMWSTVWSELLRRLGAKASAVAALSDCATCTSGGGEGGLGGATSLAGMNCRPPLSPSAGRAVLPEICEPPSAPRSPALSSDSEDEAEIRFAARSSSVLLRASSPALRAASSATSSSTVLSNSSETPVALARFLASLTRSLETCKTPSVEGVPCRLTFSMVYRRSRSASRAACPSVQSRVRSRTLCTASRSFSLTPLAASIDRRVSRSLGSSARLASCSSLSESRSSETWHLLHGTSCRSWARLLLHGTCCRTPRLTSW